MVEIKYKDTMEAADITGHTIAEARKLFKGELKIADKAAAYINGSKVTPASEKDIILNDEDKLAFKTPRNNRAAYLAGALLLAMAVTGGIFAAGFGNATATVTGTVSSSNFADVTANMSGLPAWTAYGLQKSQTGSGTLFNIDTATSGFNGDFIAIVSFANTGDLSGAYRNLTLSLVVYDSSNNTVDINNDGLSDSNDFAMLTLENSSVSLNIKQAAPDNYTIFLQSGYYICNAKKAGSPSAAGAPMLFCEVTQK